MAYRLLYQLVLRWLPPTAAHALGSSALVAVARPPAARRLLRAWSSPRRRPTGRNPLEVNALGRTFPSPLGAAAGLDKNGDWFDALGAIGFGFVELGTITPGPQDPNPSPTIVRAPADRALVNRMGFPNRGADQLAARLAARTGETLVGVNLGKQRTTALDRAAEDYRALAKRLGPHADYLVVNVSSPNTPGLRELGAVAQLEPLLAAVQQELAAVAPDRPLLVKVSPDTSDGDLDAVADLAIGLGLAGIVATNTTVNRSGLVATRPAALRRLDGGGVSGAPLKARSLEVLRRLHTRADGRLTLVSVGGVESVDDVWERLAHGATLVQAYTAFVYGGPAWAARINRQLAQRVRQAGLGSIQELIGSLAPTGPGAQ